MTNFVVKLTENKTLAVIFRMSVIVCSFFAFFVGITGHVIIMQIRDAQEVEQSMIQQMSSLQTLQKYDHEKLEQLTELVYGHRK